MKRARPDLGTFHRKVLMDDMMEVVGVSLLDLVEIDGGQSYLRGRANCHRCTCQNVCRDWLSGRGEGERADFCPNADLFHGVKDVDR
jgi:hypothetical protein